MQRRIGLPWRLGISIVIGCAVFWLALKAAVGQYGMSTMVRLPQRFSLARIKNVDSDIDAYRAARGHLPRTLAELPAKAKGARFVDKAGDPLDEWRHPLRYWTDGTHYRVTSYGRDGRPGGVGLDYDLSSEEVSKPLPERAAPQFSAAPTAPQMIQGCALGGVLGFLLGFVVLGRTTTGGSGDASLLLRLLITSAAATWVGMAIAALHLPAGH